MTQNNKMPERIWAARIGSASIWGEVNAETHSNNQQYIRADLAPAVTDEAKREALEWFFELADAVNKEFEECDDTENIKNHLKTIRALLQTPSDTAFAQPYFAGDGYIYDGRKWLKIAPSMESYAVVKINNELEALHESHDRLLEALKYAHGQMQPFCDDVIVKQAIAKAEKLQEGKL